MEAGTAEREGWIGPGNLKKSNLTLLVALAPATFRQFQPRIYAKCEGAKKLIYREVNFIDEGAHFIYRGRRAGLHRVYLAGSVSTIWGCVCTLPRPGLFFRRCRTGAEKPEIRRGI